MAALHLCSAILTRAACWLRSGRAFPCARRGFRGLDTGDGVLYLVRGFWALSLYKKSWHLSIARQVLSIARQVLSVVAKVRLGRACSFCRAGPTL